MKLDEVVKKIGLKQTLIDSFGYLGTTPTKNDKETVEIHRRIMLTNKTLKFALSILKKKTWVCPVLRQLKLDTEPGYLGE